MNTFFTLLGGLIFGFAIGIVVYRRKNELFKNENKYQLDILKSNEIEINQLKTSNLDLLEQKQQLALLNQDYKTQLKYLQEINYNQKEELLVLNEKCSVLQQDSFEFQAERNSLENQLKTYKEEISLLHKQTTFQFESIAQKLLDEKASKFTSTNKENIEAILQPLNQNIQLFKKQVEETYDKESKLRFSLDERIKELMSQTNKVSQEANNLVNALKSNHKKQGDWGEMILESILQKSGLIKDREYKVQNNLVTEEGKNVRPDIIVELPDNRAIVIDSKVSLNAYNAYCESENKEEQLVFLNNHLKAIRQHVDDLSSKNYNDLVNSLDFTMLFVPIEPAYLLAMQHDQNLWNDAYQKRILLISPTNLIACLKIIVDLWNREKQDKSAQKIVKQAEKMYDKMVLFTKSFDQVGKQLQQANDAFLKANGQLRSGRGNVLQQTQHLLKYGISPKNKLENIEDIDQDDTLGLED